MKKIIPYDGLTALAPVLKFLLAEALIASSSLALAILVGGARAPLDILFTAFFFSLPMTFVLILWLLLREEMR